MARLFLSEFSTQSKLQDCSSLLDHIEVDDGLCQHKLPSSMMGGRAEATKLQSPQRINAQKDIVLDSSS